MTPIERQQIVDLTKLHIHEYFDHYLTDVFPQQMEQYFTSHADACPVGRKVDRMKWMVAGMTALVSFLVAAGTLAYYWITAQPGH